MSEPEKPAGVQKINIKLFARAPAEFDFDILLSIFGRWRLEQGEEIMDLADYGHIDHGPNCLLVSHRWHYGLDLAQGEPAFFLSLRKGLHGRPADRISQALRLLLEKSKRLCAEPEFPRTLQPLLGDLECVINDRLSAPNTPAADAYWRPGLDEVLARLYGPGGASVRREEDPSKRLGYRIHAPQGAGWSLDDLLGRLGDLHA